MTLGEIKNQVLKILDEYSSNGEISVDDDINKRLNSLVDMAQKNIAGIAPIRKTIDVSEGEYTLGTDIIRILGVYDRDKKRAAYKQIGTTIYLPCACTLDVLTSPSTITDDTPDSYELEIKETAQSVIPLWVALNLNLVDLVIDKSYLTAAYDRAIQLIASSASPYSGTAAIV